MTDRLILYARSAGTVCSWPLVFASAFAVEVARQVWGTCQGVWRGTAGIPPQQSPQEEIAEREREKKEQQAKEAKKRQDAHRKKLEQVGAILEEKADGTPKSHVLTPINPSHPWTL